MLDGVNLDQLRTFIAAAEQGSFSAAGRKLRRAQSVVSQTLANLEGQLGVTLFDRRARYPTLTDDGRALLESARAVADQMDGFKARAKTLREGLEPELSLSIDVMYPMSELIGAVAKFRDAFPHTPLRMFVEVLGAVIEPVLQGTCQIGIVGSLPALPEAMHGEQLLDVPLVTVVAAHASAGQVQRRRLAIRATATRATRTHRSVEVVQRSELRGVFEELLAPRRHGGSACLFARRLRFRQHAAIHGRGRYRQR
jgi:DNA-binding transcriptional LysR family regulator